MTPLPPQVPMTEGMADLGNVRLAYWDTGGSGEAIVSLHPGSGSTEFYPYQQPVFAKAGYRAISYSRRGQYRSDLGTDADSHFAVPAAPAGGGVRGWGRDGLGRGVGVGEQGREGVDVVYAPLTVVALRHTDVEWAADLSDLPPACKAEPEPMKTAEAVKERLSEIPTRLYLPSECDRELLAVAAAKLVAKHRQPILDFVNRQR